MSKLELQTNELIALASQKRDFNVEGIPISLLTHQEVGELRDVEIYFDYAFLTKEHEKKFSVGEYENYNRNLISESEKIIRKVKPRYIFLASSGAVYENINKSKDSSLYGAMKLEQEDRIQTIAQEVGAQISVCRVFNLSGSFIGKLETFALSNFLSSAHLNQKIEVNSRILTTRRYCDTEELIELIVTMQKKGISKNFDSGGYEIELRDLANLVADIVKKNVKVFSSAIENKNLKNSYYSQSDAYEELLKKYLGREPLSLTKQVERTYQGMFP
jgi:UDP-glucuronate decarboxylase